MKAECSWLHEESTCICCCCSGQAQLRADKDPDSAKHFLDISHFKDMCGVAP